MEDMPAPGSHLHPPRRRREIEVTSTETVTSAVKLHRCALCKSGRDGLGSFCGGRIGGWMNGWMDLQAARVWVLL